MSSALADFKVVIHTLHELLNVIDREVTETIDSRDPNKVSPTLAPRASAELLDAYKAFSKYTDKLASFAADPSDVGVTLIGGFHETNAIQVASELGVPDVLGDEELPLSEIASRVGAEEYRLRTYACASFDHRSLILRPRSGHAASRQPFGVPRDSLRVRRLCKQPPVVRLPLGAREEPEGRCRSLVRLNACTRTIDDTIVC